MWELPITIILWFVVAGCVASVVLVILQIIFGD